MGSKFAMPMVEGSSGALRFHNSDCLHISIHGTSFSLLFSKLYKLLLQGLGLEVSIRLVLG